MPSPSLESTSQPQHKPHGTSAAPPKPDTLDDKENDGPQNEASLPPKTPWIISLADLIANPEDSMHHMPTATPQEQVTWKHEAGFLASPSSSYTIQTGTQRSTRSIRKKRSHSSSPAASQGRRSKHFRPAGDAADTQGVGQSLQRSPTRRSPNHDDPAAILWSHYADKMGHEPTLPPLPPFELSPHTPGGSKADNAFRRTASCGNEWPTSNAKRRKIMQPDPHSTTKQIFASRRKEILKPELPKQSKVSILLESVQQSFVARAREPSEPSSSSPLPERSEEEVQQENPQPVSGKQTPSPVKRLQLNAGMPHGSSPLKGRADISSDYGEFNFDDDDLENIEDALTQGHAQLNAAVPPPQCKPQSAQASKTIQPILADMELSKQSPMKVANEMAPQQQSQPAGGKTDDFDDFDDFDDDEMQRLAAKVDSQQAESAGTGLVKSKNTSLAALLDGAFDDDFDDELLQAVGYEMGSESRKVNDPIRGSQHDHGAIKRYLILDVLEGTYDTSSSRKRPEKVLSIEDEKTRQRYVVSLRQSWYDTRCVKKSHIHLIGNIDHRGQCIVDDDQNMVILHPDHLISATVIGDAISCLRRAVLQDRVKATSPPVESQVYGQILHEVFGEALKLNEWEWETLERIIAIILPNYLESLYEVGVQVADATEHLMSKVPLLKAWAELFVSATFTPDAVTRDRRGTFVPTTINKLLEVEEHVWSPMYGLKGNIDATVQAQLQLPLENLPRTVVVPLELKTGKKDNNEAHRAQTALYTLLLSDRYDVEVTSGILYYMETSATFRVEGVRNEIRQMIIWRNLLASYVYLKLELPPMIKKEHLCKRCYAQTSCFTYHKLIEDGDGDTSGLKEIFDDAVGHLKPQHQSFFKRWDELLTLEERDSMKFRRELWTMLSTEREQLGRCFSNVVIEPGSARENLQGPRINRYTYSFVKHKTVPGFSFTESQITTGEPIVISDERGHFALANGYVTSVRPRRITVAVDRRLQNARKKTKIFHPEKNQSFVGIMAVKLDGVPVSSPAEDDEPMQYRLDKDEFSNGMATVRNNLIRMMEKGLFKAKDLRDLIVDEKPPTFKHTSTAYSLSGPASQQEINIDQRAAIEKVMSAKDYALVLGMPGTGKTTTIAHIIRALVSQGKSVLLTSYTHTAVDNILLKIKDDNIPVLRLGAVGKVHPEVQSFADLSGIPKASIQELERSWQDSKVVATTCLSINHGIFNHRIFDYCIVDEASQITLPVCVGPIRMAHTFILVGDHYQLPPLVQNKDAQQGGLDVSLFKLLSDAQPSSVVSLEHQYRMNEDIMLLSSRLIYNDRLKCGNAAVALRSLKIPNLQAALDAHHHHSTTSSAFRSSASISTNCCSASHANCYLRLSLLPHHRALFLNTDTIITPAPATESQVGSRITNAVESLLTAHLLTTLIRSGVPARLIGVITFYRSQLALLRQDIKAIAGTNAAADVEMHTADKYQGRDKEVILLSCVRSNTNNHVGELLKDWRRVNVAITRAKSKLIIIGSQSTLAGSGVPVLEGLIQIMDEKKWIMNIPADPMTGHKFESLMPSQTQTSAAPVPAKTIRAATTTAALTTLHTTNRKPLQPVVNANSSHISRTPINTTNPTKPQRPQPKKVVQGSIDVEELLDRRPIMRDVVKEMAPATVYFDADDFDDEDEMLIDF